MIRKSTFRQAGAMPEMARMACPHCGARLTFDPTVSAGRIQCPKCLNPIEWQPSEASPAAAPRVVRPVAAGPVVAPAGAGAADVAGVSAAERGGRDTHAQLASVMAERDEARRRLKEAEAMLAEAGHALDRLQELEHRIKAMGARYLLALERVRELERQRGAG